MLYRAISLPMIAATAVAARFRAVPAVRAAQAPAAEDPEAPVEEQPDSVLHIRLPGLPMTFIRDGELPLLRKSVRLFESAQAMLNPVNRKIAYDILTRGKIGRTHPTVRERIDAIRLVMKNAGR